MAKLQPSEFEGDGTHKAGTFSHTEVKDKLRIIYRTGQDADVPSVDLDAEPDDWNTGGIRNATDVIA